MRSRWILAALAGAAVLPRPLVAEPVPRAVQTSRTRYAAQITEDNAARRAAVQQVRIEQFDGQGRLLRWEQRAADGTHQLTWIGVYFGDEGAPSRAAYWSADTDVPFAELGVTAPDGSFQDVYYSDFGEKPRRQLRQYFDAAARIVFQEYFAPRSQKKYSEEIYRYDDRGNELGRLWRRLDGRAQRETSFGIVATDAHGRWTERNVFVDGKLVGIDVREIVDGSALGAAPKASAGPVTPSNAILPVPFAPGVVSTKAAGENALTFAPDGRTVLFTRYEDWEAQRAFTSTWRDGVWREAEELALADTLYNAALRADGQHIVYCVRDDASGGARVFTTARTDSGWSAPRDWTSGSGFTGSYFRWLANGTLYFHRGGDLYRCRFDRAGASDETPLPAAINTPDGTEFGAWVDDDETLLLFARYVDGQPERTGVFATKRRGDGWDVPRKLPIPYGWSPVLSPDGEDLVYVVDENLVRVPVVLLDLPR